MSENNYILKTNAVYKTYPMGASRLEVLKGVDIAVKKGEFIAVTGASGSGKSTLLHILGALDTPDSGTVEFENCNLGTLTGRQLNNFRNKTIGFVFQFYHLLDELTVLENVLLPAMAGCSIIGWFAVRNSAKKRAKQLLEQIGLGERLNHKPFQLSGGERQRVAIARALINSPELLLADEPTGNLDSQTGNGILKLLEQINGAGQTIVMVTHDEKIAVKAHRIVKLADGKIVI